MKRTVLVCFSLILCAFLLSSCSFVAREIRDVGNEINEIKDTIKDEVKDVLPIAPTELSDNYKTSTWEAEDDTDITFVAFDNISFTNYEDGIDIKLIHSETPRVEATYSEDLENYGFAVDINNGWIRISVDKPRNFRTGKFAMTVYANFDEINLEGGLPLDIDATGAKNLSLDVSGAVDADICGVDAEDVSIVIDGAGEVDISGTSNTFSLDISGAGEVDGKKLHCKKANIEISGAGEADISVSDELYVRLSGAGEVEYYGSPSVTNDSAGATKVKQKSPEAYT